MTFDCVLKAWSAYEPEIRGYLLHRLNKVDAAEDVLHEVFLKAINQGEAFCQLVNPRAWLFQVTRNTLVDLARLTKCSVELSEHLVKAEPDRAPVDELDACLLSSLSKMSENEREIIECCDLQGIRQQEFADNHALSLAATKSRLLRARQHLRQILIHNCQLQYDNSGRICCHKARIQNT